jgi:hypothetical protein
VLYVHLFGDPADKDITVSSLAVEKKLFDNKVVKVSVIGSNTSVKWSLQDKGLIVRMPGKLTFKDCNVLKVQTTSL